MLTCKPNPDIDLSYLDTHFTYVTNEQIQAIINDIMADYRPKASHSKYIHKMDLLKTAIAKAGHEAVAEWALARQSKVAA